MSNVVLTDLKPAAELVMTIAPPSPWLQHRRQCGLDREVDALEVHVDGVDEGRDVQPLLPRRRKDPGVGDDEVEPAEFGDAVGHDLLEPVEVADVGLLGDDAPTGLLDEVDRLVEILAGRHRVRDAVDLTAQVERDDVGPLLGEPDRVAAALAARRPGDEDDLPVELSCHDAPHYGGA